MNAEGLGDGVILLNNVIPASEQEQVVSMLLEGSTVKLETLEDSSHKNNPFFAFCQLFSLRWKNQPNSDDDIPVFVRQLSEEVHRILYGEHGVYPNQENGCSEDHQVKLPVHLLFHTLNILLCSTDRIVTAQIKLHNYQDQQFSIV